MDRQTGLEPAERSTQCHWDTSPRRLRIRCRCAQRGIGIDQFDEKRNRYHKSWGRVLHDEDLAQAIIDRVLERGRLLRLDGPSVRTLHVHLDEAMKEESDQQSEVARISGTDKTATVGPNTSLGLVWSSANRGEWTLHSTIRSLDDSTGVSNIPAAYSVH